MKEKNHTVDPCRESIVTKEPFDLKRAMAGEPIVTRDGREAKLIKYDGNDSDCFVVKTEIEGHNKWFYVNGRYVDHGETPLDLFMAPVQKKLVR